MKFLKFEMVDGSHSENRFFGHHSAADCPISVKFCVGKQFFREFLQWNRYTRSTEHIFLFP